MTILQVVDPIHNEHIINLLRGSSYYDHSNLTDSTISSIKGFDIISMYANCESGVISKYYMCHNS